jgi:hypothetical protein
MYESPTTRSEEHLSAGGSAWLAIPPYLSDESPQGLRVAYYVEGRMACAPIDRFMRNGRPWRRYRNARARNRLARGTVVLLAKHIG